MSTKNIVLMCAMLVCCCAMVHGEERKAEDTANALPDYEPTRTFEGELEVYCNMIVSNVMAITIEAFLKHHPDLKINEEQQPYPLYIDGPRFVDDPLCVYAGPIATSEHARKRLEDRKTKHAVEIVFMTPMTFVVVHPDNPIQDISIAQLKSVYAKGADASLTWGDIGVNDAEWRDQPIRVYGRNTATFSAKEFRRVVLGREPFREDMEAQPGSKALLEAVGADRSGIGFTMLPGDRPLKVHGVEPTPENAYSQKYALGMPARMLCVDVKSHPLHAEFMRFMLTKQGQAQVVRDGWLPLSVETVNEQRAILDNALTVADDEEP